MYKLKKIEDILLLPNNNDNCIINRQLILEYIYRNKNNSNCIFNIEILHDILIIHTKKAYIKDIFLSNIVLNKKEIMTIQSSISKFPENQLKEQEN